MSEAEDTDIIGEIAWNIEENTVLPRSISTGAKKLRLDDVQIIVDSGWGTDQGPAPKPVSPLSPFSWITSQFGSKADRYRKRIFLDKGFHLHLASSPQAERSQLTGFGMVAGQETLTTFNWEWFDIVNDRRARKRQESGELGIRVREVNSKWEITRTEFLSDVSFRVSAVGCLNLLGFIASGPVWRVNIKQGSYVNWPSIIDGRIVPSVVD